MLTWSVFVLLLLVGLFIGSMSRRNMIYGVKIPVQLISDERVRKVKTVYIIRYLSVMITVLAMVAIFIDSEIRQTSVFVVLWILMTSIIYVLSNRDMKNIKEELKDEYQGQRKEVNTKRVTIVWDDRKLKKHLALVFIPNWILILLGLLVYGMNYTSLPERIPINYDLQGNIINYADKSLFSVFLMLAICLIVTIGIFLLMKLNISAKKEIGRLNPEEDGKNLFIARERLNIVLSGVMLCMNMLIIGIPAITFGWLPGGVDFVMAASIAVLLVIMIIFFIFMMTTGFSGDRLSKDLEMKNKSIIFEESEEKWKWGMIYYNREDPALMVEKRMGGGYTFNFGNPKALLIFIGILAVAALIVIGSYILV